MSKSQSADDVKLMKSFEGIRSTLLADHRRERLEEPLAYWTLANDRRLPLAFLSRTLNDLLSQTYNELAGTAGIGRRKMQSLITLLQRAAKDELSTEVLSSSTGPVEEVVQANGNAEPAFDPGLISELTWAKWRETVRLHGIGHELLGRLAPSLQALPTVIWNTPVSFYLDLTLAELRRLKTHGEKRIRVVLGVFHRVHQMLTHVDPALGLTIRLTPRFVGQIEDWIHELKARKFAPARTEFEERMILPLLAQIEIDAGPTVASIARARMGIGADNQSVRNQARTLGVTRARIYQLLEECHHVMQVRWPDGKRQIDDLALWLDQNYASAECANLIAALRELLYPLKFDSVAEHLQPQSVRRRD
jgi:hypothetical protein